MTISYHFDTLAEEEVDSEISNDKQLRNKKKKLNKLLMKETKNETKGFQILL